MVSKAGIRTRSPTSRLSQKWLSRKLDDNHCRRIGFEVPPRYRKERMLQVVVHLSYIASSAFGNSLYDNTGGSCLTWFDRTTHGEAFRNVRSFGAVGDGITDDTAAIQAALDYKRGNVGAKRPALIYLPPGTYNVNDTLVCWFHTHMVGSSLCNSTIRLRKSSPGFSVPAPHSSFGYYTKPVVVFQSGFNIPTDTHAWWADHSNPVTAWWCHNTSKSDMPCGDGFNMNFFSHIRNIRIEVQEGNPGASGLMWNVAQQTSIRNVTIDLTRSGAVGLDVSGDASDVLAYHENNVRQDRGGGGTIEDVDIVGGVWGMRASGSQWTLRGLRIRQSSAVGVVLLGDVWSFTFIDLRVSNTPLAVTIQHCQAVLFVDCAFSNISGPFAVAVNAHSQLYLERVALESSTGGNQSAYLVNTGVKALPPNQAYYTGRAFHQASTLPINGFVPAASWQETPTMLLRGRRTFDDVTPDTFVNVLEGPGCKGNWVADDTACLQHAIDSAQTVFLPYGFYRVSRPIFLRNGTRLVGECLSRIVLTDNATGYSNVDDPRPVIVANEGTDVVITDVRITSGAFNPGAVLLWWNVSGAASGLWDVHLSCGSGAEGAGGRTRGPVQFVGCAFEHHVRSAFNLSGVSDVTFYALQTENTANATVISDADRVLVYGSVITLSREWVQSMVTVTNTTNLAIYGLNTLMKRQPSPVKNWSMVVFPDHPDWNVPSLIPHGGEAPYAGVLTRAETRRVLRDFLDCVTAIETVKCNIFFSAHNM
eukprot:m.469749 g.469749  ORF g.469749 m.469749 type:complete len:760 (+) comp21649_c0_seq79:646-2925(+)